MTNPRDHTILFVDDEENIRNALYRLFRREGYNILIAGGGVEGLELMLKNRVSLVISDHRMPGMEGVEFLRRVKERSPDTVRIMLTGYADLASTMNAVNESEVHRYITKPWDDVALKLTVRDLLDRHELKDENRRLLEVTRRQNKELAELNEGLERKVEERTRQLRESFFNFIKTSAGLMELFDSHLGGHVKRTAGLSREMAVGMGLHGREVAVIEAAALLHDIGLIGVPKGILRKGEDAMNDAERFIFRQHPALGQETIASTPDLRQVALLIRSHHEEWSGGGYPDGLKAEEIPMGSRIIAAASRFDDLSAGGRRSAIEGLKGGRGVEFDPDAVNCLVETMEGKREEAGVEDIPFSRIAGGMVLAGDIMTKSGKLLLPMGSAITAALIERLRNFHAIDPIVDKISIEKTE
ncbi:MAG: response regulator [Deltaproteobacteria bacterium]|nr:response regulator [Deltaproteobacteria bacterium]